MRQFSIDVLIASPFFVASTWFARRRSTPPELRIASIAILMLLLSALSVTPSKAETPSTRPDRAEPGASKDNASKVAPEDPSLPRVLIIGDSISIGYLKVVRAELKGRANVQHCEGNASSTTTGLQHLDGWLATGNEQGAPPKKWDVISFNWGLHDLKVLKHVDNKPVYEVSPEDYEKNLRMLVAKLKATGAKLIWCTTTPVPEGKMSPERHREDVPTYNAIAERVMKDNDIKINDLYGLILPNEQRLQAARNVHYSPEGYQELGKQVADAVEQSLPAK